MTCKTSVPVSKNAQESPTLATTSSQPTRQATVAVVPDSCREEAFQDQRRVYESPLESRECVASLQTSDDLEHVEHLVLIRLMALSMTVPRSPCGDDALRHLQRDDIHVEKPCESFRGKEPRSAEKNKAPWTVRKIRLGGS